MSARDKGGGEMLDQKGCSHGRNFGMELQLGSFAGFLLVGGMGMLAWECL